MRLTRDVRVVKRAQALLWLSDGDTPDEVADRLWVTPRTIYHWIERFEGRDDWPLAERLADAPRSGRPNRVAQRLDPLIEQFMDDSLENHAGNDPAIVLRGDHRGGARLTGAQARACRALTHGDLDVG